MSTFRYLQNVIANPSEGKYRKIRLGNKAFQVSECNEDRVVLSVGLQERVAAILGSVGFLKAIGFEEKTGGRPVCMEKTSDPVLDDGEVFLVLPSDVPIDTLTQAKEVNYHVVMNCHGKLT